MPETFEIFLVAMPGLEVPLLAEAQSVGFTSARIEPGGVAFNGTWHDVWRANLQMRGAGRVLVRFAHFRVTHLAQLDKKARGLDWSAILRADVPVRVEATCRKSKIYHSGAAAQRVETAIAEELGAPVSSDAIVRVLVRIDNDECTVSVDTSGEGLHKRGHKQAVNKAPMRETLAALFLRQCGYEGQEPVVDPMCGSGTFVIEAAEIAVGLPAGRARHFAFEKLAGFDPTRWDNLRSQYKPSSTDLTFYGSDRDAGAIAMSIANAERAGISERTQFSQKPVEALERPDSPTGLVIVNPPYGLRIGDRKKLYPVYGALGQVLQSRFSGWRVGLITADPSLARATGLPFEKPGRTVDNNGIRIALYRTKAL
ncbi:THUMP domain-containing class I SAM-dependent RNA methyltransferase [Pelagibacterium luteolum]|uniref:Putative N6-adenine-specific DNA methylase n=1 Tax=Pelagibacterium luteolum TaxID=440168 RepID=A0A1G7ZDX6_9HYPH|nr:class I SAM-dependent RNA methyltransferase [Pelagibacterium luteolum]SDH06849.1 putative N6-adenine-specific DNA methylase [Pelagibacterium luteolum]